MFRKPVVIGFHIYEPMQKQNINRRKRFEFEADKLYIGFELRRSQYAANYPSSQAYETLHVHHQIYCENFALSILQRISVDMIRNAYHGKYKFRTDRR